MVIRLVDVLAIQESTVHILYFSEYADIVTLIEIVMTKEKFPFVI